MIPPDQLAGDAWKAALGDRAQVAETGIIQWMTFSPTDEQLKDNVKLRKALSRRSTARRSPSRSSTAPATPATGWVSPVVDGYKAGQCGDACTFDAAKAKTLYDESGGYQGQLTISVNPDGGHKLWADAVCNGCKNNLGVDCAVNVTPDFATLRTQIKAGELKGIVPRWLADGLPVDRELPDPDLRQGCGVQRQQVRQPRLRQAKLTDGRCRHGPADGQREVPGGRGDAGQRIPDAPDVVLRHARSAAPPR